MSRLRRIENLNSDIFNRGGDNNEAPYEKRVKARVTSVDEKFNPYKNHQSSIVF